MNEYTTYSSLCINLTLFPTMFLINCLFTKYIYTILCAKVDYDEIKIFLIQQTQNMYGKIKCLTVRDLSSWGKFKGNQIRVEDD